MSKLVVSSLRIILILIAATVLTAQILLPYVAEQLGGPYVEVSHLVIPYSVAGILSLLSFQIALAGVWWLLSLSSRGRIFAAQAIRWVDIVIFAVAGAALVPALTMVHLLFFVGVGGPSVGLGLMFCLVCGSALVLLLIVMKSLLALAIENRSELDVVI